jgi:HSP20 family protein
MDRLQQEMESMFGRCGVAQRRCGSGSISPALNVWEDGDNLLVEAELPGLDLDEIEILVDGEDRLTIQGERRRADQENAAWHRQERGYGKFSREVELPHEVDIDKVTAELEQGVLTITLPKRESLKPRRIHVQGA